VVSEAGKRAQKKYDSQFDIIRFRVPKGQREVIQRFAEEHGESVNQLLNRLLHEEMSQKP
jgi:predicted HicB family RNase H-like nuclease